jgi:threonine dehydrogenase-like Zn-dependent dehydrogenase
MATSMKGVTKHASARTSARAFWATAPDCGDIQDLSLPAPKPDEVLVKTLFSGISKGTESLVFRGEVPVSEHQRMRAPWQAGDFTFPVKYGYINVGVVEQGPEHLQGCHVFCLYPHQTRFVVPASAVTVLPQNVPAARAVLTANLETALNVLWDAQPAIGDRIAVIGAGAVGCLVAWLASGVRQTEVTLIDTNPGRQSIADALGVTFSTPSSLTGATSDYAADLVIHASGHPAGLTTALALAGFEARVVEASWFGARDVSVPLGAEFHSRRLTLISSQVGHIATAQRARWDYSRRLSLVLSLLADPTLDALINAESDFEDLPETLRALSDLHDDRSNAPSRATLCHRIRYP